MVESDIKESKCRRKKSKRVRGIKKTVGVAVVKKKI